MKIEQKKNPDHFGVVKNLAISSPMNNRRFFSNRNSIVGDLKPKLHSNITLPLSTSRSNLLLLAVVVMLGTRVVDIGIVDTLVADRRESFTGATMVKFWLFAHLVLQLLFILKFVSKFYYIHEYFQKLLIVQYRPSKYSDYATLVQAVLFHFVYAPVVSDWKINPFDLIPKFICSHW